MDDFTWEEDADGFDFIDLLSEAHPVRRRSESNPWTYP